MSVTRVGVSPDPEALQVQPTACELVRDKKKVCQLCFQGDSAKHKSSILSTSVVHRFLDEKALPTPFLYAYLQHLRKKMDCFFVCGNCDSWIRRQNPPRPMHTTMTGKRVFFAVDRLILSIMLPGNYAPPEMRITQRLVTTIRTDRGRNWLATICPPLVIRTICDNDILLASRKVLKSISVATWRSGRCQTVLGNANFAKNIRCAQHDL
ncbi:hypothetical protein T484DRAFT_1756356 [Baffinella frigidus]|nr:hypothetical protein T484DRAFT_1756356 [Cryptophyta sp. CCMP2293]